MRANSGLKAQEYSGPILGLIFLRFAEVRFADQHAKLEAAGASSRRGSRVDEPAAYHADNVLYLAPEARFDYLLTLPEAADIGDRVNAAMREVEKHNPQLAGVLPKTFNLFTGTLLKELLKKISEIPATLDFDAFGRIYEYFLGEFAMSEGQGRSFRPQNVRSWPIPARFRSALHLLLVAQAARHTAFRPRPASRARTHSSRQIRAFGAGLHVHRGG